MSPLKIEALIGMARTHALTALSIAYEVEPVPYPDVPHDLEIALDYLNRHDFAGAVAVYTWAWGAIGTAEHEAQTRAAMAVLWCCTLPTCEREAHAILRTVADHAAAAMAAHRETVRVTGRERLG